MKDYCFYHNNMMAVKECTKCGKSLCIDCYDNLGISSKEYLCYDCLMDLAEDKIRKLQYEGEIIRKKRIISILGCIAGAVIGGVCGSFIDSAVICAILFAMIGGSVVEFLFKFRASIPKFFVRTGNVAISATIGVLKCVGYFVIYAFKSWIDTIRMILKGMIRVRRINKLLAEKTESIAMISDYMKYTKISDKENNKNIKELKNKHKEITDNKYANIIVEQGEKSAKDEVRKCVRTIYYELSEK